MTVEKEEATERRVSGQLLMEQATIGQMRGGLTFLKTRDRKSLVEFYQSKIGMSVWLEQANITILTFGNLLLGWHQIMESPSVSNEGDDSQNFEQVQPDVSGMITFVYPTKEEVDAMYIKFQDINADGPPRVNTRYQIYQFFAKDPEGRALEFQAFLHPLCTVTSQV